MYDIAILGTLNRPLLVALNGLEIDMNELEKGLDTLAVVLRVNTLADELFATQVKQAEIISEIQQAVSDYIIVTNQIVKELQNGTPTPRTK